MPRRFHPASYIDNGLRSGVSCVGPLEDDRNPFLVQYQQFQCMPIEVFPNPTALVRLIPKVVCAMPAPWESSALRIYKHQWSSVHVGPKVQKQKVTLLWELLQNASASLNWETWRWFERPSKRLHPAYVYCILSLSFVLEYIQVLWVLVKICDFTEMLGIWVSWHNMSRNRQNISYPSCTVVLWIVWLLSWKPHLSQLVNMKKNKIALERHTCACPWLYKVNRQRKKQIKTLNITIWVISRNPAEKNILFLNTFVTRDKCNLLWKRDLRRPLHVTFCDMQTVFHMLQSSTKTIDAPVVPIASRSSNHSFFDLFFTIYSAVRQEHRVCCPHYPCLFNPGYHDPIWPILNPLKLLWHH